MFGADRRDIMKGYIFDFGGTIDTSGCHWGRLLWHAMERNGVPVTEEQFREAYVYAERTLGSNPIIQTNYDFHKTIEIKLRIEMEYFVRSKMWDCTEAEWRAMHARILDDVYGIVSKTIAENKKVLEKIAEEYPIVLVSNFYGNMQVVLKEFGLDKLFKSVVESAVVGIRKPDERIFRMGVEALGMEPEDVTVVGDSFKKDILPSKKIGCKAVWIKGEGWTDERFDETIPDRVITSLKELIL